MRADKNKRGAGNALTASIGDISHQATCIALPIPKTLIGADLQALGSTAPTLRAIHERRLLFHCTVLIGGFRCCGRPLDRLNGRLYLS